MHKFIFIGIALILILGGKDVFKLADSKAPSVPPELRSGFYGYCLDDYHNGSGVNAEVDLWTCNGSAAQHWTVEGSTIKHDSTHCLAVKKNSQPSGSSVVANLCNGSPEQKWALDEGGYKNSSSGLCLDAATNNPGTKLTLGSCNKLSTMGEAWAKDSWSENNGAYPGCDKILSKGAKVACFARYQWNTWQANPKLHPALLTDYTDGNSYEEWCADFVSYIYKEAGYPFNAGERSGWDEYNANNIQFMPGFTYHPANNYVPKSGDVAFFDYPGGHVELVSKGGINPTYIFGDSGTTDPTTGNGDMNQDTLSNDGPAGGVTYYLSPN